MERLTPAVLRGSRASLVVLWFCTALVSLIELHRRSEELLRLTGLPNNWHDALIIGGSMLDGIVGLVLWRWHRPAAYLLAAANLCIMTVVASVMLPSLWLDPLGSLTKNLPVAALLWILHQESRQ